MDSITPCRPLGAGRRNIVMEYQYKIGNGGRACPSSFYILYIPNSIPSSLSSVKAGWE